MQFDESKLEFAYKYPFSNDSKDIIQQMNISKISYPYLQSAKNHIEMALNGVLDYKRTNISSAKIDYITNYAYCRMLLSAYSNPIAIKKYAEAEAFRSSEALSLGTPDEFLRLSKQLGVSIFKRFAPEKENEFSMQFNEFLKYNEGINGLELVNQRLSGGAVIMDWNNSIRFMQAVISSKIKEGLPIRRVDLPNEVVEFAKSASLSIKVQASSQNAGSQRGWIEQLLNNPIPDVRHRTVNLILAPYLVNVKGLAVEAATKVINDYIEKCKQLNPDTKITERYIAYQCEYAKKKGTKPLSQARAKELLGSIVDLWKDVDNA
ncbi:MAG: DNA primase noncatalytic subunit PriX [Candidatus Micrarchaeia archaeon]